MSIFRRRQHTAIELTTYAISRQNWRGAAAFILAGAAEVICTAPGADTATSEEKAHALRVALINIAHD